VCAANEREREREENLLDFYQIYKSLPEKANERHEK
jgi:hypothetical protein